MKLLSKLQKKYGVTAGEYSKKDYQTVLDILHKIDALVDRLKKEDRVYGDMWQNFANPEKEKITDELIAMVVQDMKKAKK